MNSESTRLTGTGSADPTAATQLRTMMPTGPETGPDSAPTAPPLPAAEATQPPSPTDIPPGTLLVNTYRVERLLGGGGMGEVYLTRHAGLGSLHAVKVIRPAMAANRQVMDLFYREAKVLRGVRNDAVVSYEGFLRDAEGRDYLVMEFVEGSSLAERLREGPLPPEEVLILRDRLAAGLAAAHRHGAIHRDISPDNVILPDAGVTAAKLIDFGLSKLTDPAEATIIGDSFAGKYRFASPEQFGMFGGVVDGRSDIYSLGLILAAAALGHPLDMTNSIDAALRARLTVPDLTQIPAPIRPWLSAMLEPDPARRPASLDTLLLKWPAHPPVAQRSHTPDGWRPPAEPAPRGRMGPLLWGGGAVLTVAAAAGIYFILRPLETTPPPGRDQPGATTASVATGSQRLKPPESGSPATMAENIESLTQAGRYDEALKSARSLIAAPPASGLPNDALVTLTKQLRVAGRPADAFALVEALIAAEVALPAADLWALAQDLREAGHLDPWFFLVRTLANHDDGPAAFALAEMYDPLHWAPGTSPLPKPRPDKAQEWYRKAQARGVPEAAARLEALKTAPGG